MTDSFLYICRLCYGKHMTKDFDKGMVVCNDCDAKFEVTYGAWRNPGTDEAWRPEYLGEQIKE